MHRQIWLLLHPVGDSFFVSSRLFHLQFFSLFILQYFSFNIVHFGSTIRRLRRRLYFLSSTTDKWRLNFECEQYFAIYKFCNSSSSVAQRICPTNRKRHFSSTLVLFISHHFLRSHRVAHCRTMWKLSCFVVIRFSQCERWQRYKYLLCQLIKLRTQSNAKYTYTFSKELQFSWKPNFIFNPVHKNREQNAEFRNAKQWNANSWTMCMLTMGYDARLKRICENHEKKSTGIVGGYSFNDTSDIQNERHWCSLASLLFTLRTHAMALSRRQLEQDSLVRIQNKYANGVDSHTYTHTHTRTIEKDEE